MVLARSVWGGVAWGGRVVYVYPLLPLGGRSGVLPGCVRGVRWWFENSRAYLYYFFMVK